MAIGGHVPHEGLDVFSGDPEVRCATRAEDDRLLKPGVWGLARLQTDLETVPALHMRWRGEGNRVIPPQDEINPIHQYATNILLEFVPYVDAYQRRSEIFESTSHPEVGYMMLRDAARILVENTFFCGERLVDKYKRAKVQRRLRPDAPEECADLLVGTLGSRGGLAVVFGRLKARIREEHDAEALVA
ncbi:MAG TPA: hypothetical protein VHD60_01345 [Candidatus Saccharimonadales bacterium]|nr:hypothetical protein [Candidatus Saccharimonadales bacterium]